LTDLVFFMRASVARVRFQFLEHFVLNGQRMAAFESRSGVILTRHCHLLHLIVAQRDRQSKKVCKADIAIVYTVRIMSKRNTTAKQESVLFLAPDVGSLEMFVEALNTDFYHIPIPINGGWQRHKGDYRPVQCELRRLVKAWFDSGPNVMKLFSDDPVLALAAMHCRAHLIATKTNRARVICMTVPENMPPGEPLETALGLFLGFLIDPYNEKLGGPCKHCDKFYVKKTKRQVVYCSKRCGLNHTSQSVLRKRRQQDHLATLKRAERSAAMWAKTKTSKDWKSWVAREPLITKNFLTRAVRNGELSEPVKLT